MGGGHPWDGRTHLQPVPLRQEMTDPPRADTHLRHPPPAATTRPSVLISANEPLWTDTLAGTHGSSPLSPGEQTLGGTLQ